MKEFKISEEMKDQLEELLEDAARGSFYDNPNGPWGYECAFCKGQSTDGRSSPPHDDDCPAADLLKKLRDLDEPE